MMPSLNQARDHITAAREYAKTLDLERTSSNLEAHQGEALRQVIALSAAAIVDALAALTHAVARRR